MPKSDKSECQLTVGPFFQCCCTCRNHLPVHFHCCTEPKPETPNPDVCACGVQKGWACVQDERVYDNWSEHSCGCELHAPKIVPDKE